MSGFIVDLFIEMIEILGTHHPALGFIVEACSAQGSG